MTVGNIVLLHPATFADRNFHNSSGIDIGNIAQHLCFVVIGNMAGMWSGAAICNVGQPYCLTTTVCIVEVLLGVTVGDIGGGGGLQEGRAMTMAWARWLVWLKEILNSPTPCDLAFAAALPCKRKVGRPLDWRTISMSWNFIAPMP